MTDYNRIKLNIFEKASDGLITEEQKIVLLEKAEFANMIANKDCILESYDRLLQIMESPEYIMEVKSLDNMREFNKVKKEYKETLKSSKQHLKNKEYSQAKQDINKMVAQITMLEKQLRENPPSLMENMVVNMMASIVSCVKEFTIILGYLSIANFATKTIVNKDYGFKTPKIQNAVKSYHVIYAGLVTMLNEIYRDLKFAFDNIKAAIKGEPLMANKQIADFCKHLQKFKVNLAKTSVVIDKKTAVEKCIEEEKENITDTNNNDQDTNSQDMDNDDKANAEN